MTTCAAPITAADHESTPLPAQCATAYSLTIPRILRCEKDLDSLHEKVRELRSRMDGVSISHEDSVKRISLVEGAINEQRVENLRTHTDIETLKTAVKAMGDRIETIVNGMALLADKFDQQGEELKRIFLNQAQEHEDSVRRHANLSKWAIRVAAGLAMTGIGFTALHAAITGESVFASLASYLTMLGAK